MIQFPKVHCTLGIGMKQFDDENVIFDKMADNFSEVLCLCYDSAYAGRLTTTTAFEGAI